jgi:hypothetical protein
MEPCDTQFWPMVVQAVAGKDYTVFAYFNDGSIHQFDMKPYIHEGSVFESLRNKELFSTAITVLNDTLAWDINGTRDPRVCLDIDPFTLYEAELAPDPLR